VSVERWCGGRDVLLSKGCHTLGIDLRKLWDILNELASTSVRCLWWKSRCSISDGCKTLKMIWIICYDIAMGRLPNTW